MDPYVKKIKEAAEYIRTKFPVPTFSPKVALTFGSGLRKLAQLIKPVATIPYSEIPHFPHPTVPDHEGTLLAGTLEGLPVLGFKGRKHYYEVADQPRAMDQVVFPVHVAANLGCKMYIATNAAGGLNPTFYIGSLMVIRSHISFFLPNPLLGKHHDFGDNLEFQPLHAAYTKDLRDLFKSLDPAIHEGVYCATTGKTYETQAESLLLRKLGADAVGMSTIPEIIVAHNRGMQTLGISIITNVISADGTNATSHEEVTAILNSQNTEDKLLKIFQNFFKKLGNKLA